LLDSEEQGCPDIMVVVSGSSIHWKGKA